MLPESDERLGAPGFAKFQLPEQASNNAESESPFPARDNNERKNRPLVGAAIRSHVRLLFFLLIPQLCTPTRALSSTFPDGVSDIAHGIQCAFTSHYHYEMHSSLAVIKKKFGYINR
jgi:hypothetical protein